MTTPLRRWIRLKLLPTQLTILRIVLAPIGLAFLLWPVRWHFIIALVIFIVGILTDFFDGYLSRRFNAVTTFGARLDIIADKFFILCYFVFLQIQGIYPLWLFVLLLLRECVVLAGLAMIPVDHAPRVVFPAKMKMLFQGVSISLGIMALLLPKGETPALVLQQWSVILMIIALLLGFAFVPSSLPPRLRGLFTSRRSP